MIHSLFLLKFIWPACTRLLTFTCIAWCSPLPTCRFHTRRSACTHPLDRRAHPYQHKFQGCKETIFCNHFFIACFRQCEFNAVCFDNRFSIQLKQKLCLAYPFLYNDILTNKIFISNWNVCNCGHKYNVAFLSGCFTIMTINQLINKKILVNSKTIIINVILPKYFKPCTIYEKLSQLPKKSKTIHTGVATP